MEKGDSAPKNGHIRPRRRWLGLLALLAVVVALSFVLAYFVNRIAQDFNFPLEQYAWLAYLTVFLVSLISNLTVVAPVPFQISVMLAASATWNPAVIGLMGAFGGAFGELSGYYAGRLGMRIAVTDDVPGYDRLRRWIRKYGVWAIFLLALQPVLPFDLGGLIAGGLRMPLTKFLPALFAGKAIKYVAISYAGAELIRQFPFFVR